MKCKVCGQDTDVIFTATILNKYKNIKYFICRNCEFLQTEKPFWLEEAYSKAIIDQDTGILIRNNSLSEMVSILIYFFFNKTDFFLDYGGGYGLFTRMMRDIGFNFFWYDPLAENIFANGFEYDLNCKDIGLVTSFECFEHFEDPMIEIEKMFNFSSNIIFSTQLLPQFIPAPGQWWYYAFEGGQHISFYSEKTLKYIARKYDVFFYSWGGVHLFSSKKINNFLFSKILHYGKGFLFSYVKRNMNCKCVDDMNFIIRKGLKNDKTQNTF